MNNIYSMFKIKTTNRITLYNKENNDWLGYISYYNKLDHYWAPRIYVSFIETNINYRRQGIASLLLEELKLEFPGEIITLEIYDGGETHVDILENFYYNNNFIKIEETSKGAILAYIPEGRNIKELKDVPASILYDEVKFDKQNYIFIDYVIEDIQMFIEDDGINLDLMTLEEFVDYHELIKDSENGLMLKYV